MRSLLAFKLYLVPDIVVHAFNPSSQEAEAKDHELEVTLGYIVCSWTA
jgi:hypothetical protein